jgi:hypothetical protein
MSATNDAAGLGVEFLKLVRTLFVWLSAIFHLKAAQFPSNNFHMCLVSVCTPSSILIDQTQVDLHRRVASQVDLESAEIKDIENKWMKGTFADHSRIHCEAMLMAMASTKTLEGQKLAENHNEDPQKTNVQAALAATAVCLAQLISRLCTCSPRAAGRIRIANWCQ